MSDYNDSGTVPDPLCLRCGIGIDDDGDGDCSVCASASNRLILALTAARELAVRNGRQLHETILMLDAAKKSHYSTVAEALEKAARIVRRNPNNANAPTLVERLKEDYR